MPENHPTNLNTTTSIAQPVHSDSAQKNFFNKENRSETGKGCKPTERPHSGITGSLEKKGMIAKYCPNFECISIVWDNVAKFRSIIIYIQF
jgi:hypothetical protein